MSFLLDPFKDGSARAGLLVALFLVLATVGLVWWVGPTAESRILHFNIYFGIDLYAAGTSLWWNPLAAGLIWLVNWIIASVVSPRQLLAARLAAWSAVLTVAIVFSATLLIVFYRPS